MSHSYGLLIESLVAVLLVLTIGYCMLLNKRLKALKADEHSLKATIAELITATEIAERAIGGLKVTVRECNTDLGGRIELASSLVERLEGQIDLGNDIVRRLSRIALAARPANDPILETRLERKAEPKAVAKPEPRIERRAEPKIETPRVSNPQAIAAAARAFSERRRAGSIAA